MPSDAGKARPAWLRLSLFLALFVGLTALGIWWAAPDFAGARSAWTHFVGLPLRTHVVLAALALGLIGAEMLRLFVFGRAISVRIGFRAALDATIANNFFSWITPGSALGEPASAYMLHRHGISWDAAALISFAKFATSLVLILGLGCAVVAAGLGPPVSGLVIVPLVTAIAIGASMMLALLLGALAPRRSSAFVARRAAWLRSSRIGRGTRGGAIVTSIEGVVRRAISRLSQFRAAGAPGAVTLLASHLVYYGTFLAIFLVLADAFAAPSILEVAPVAIVYQGFLYIAPTPGGAALGEATADVFFAGLIPGVGAFAVVILYRALTFYFHIALGLAYLAAIGVIGAILSQARGSTDSTDEASEPRSPDDERVADEGDGESEADRD